MAVVLLALGPHRAQHLHGRVAQPAGGEAEQFGAGGIQPLEVVRDDQHRALGGKGAQRRQHGEPQREPVTLEGGLAAAGQRRLQGGALGCGQLSRDLVQDQAEQVGQRQEGQVGFGLGGRAAQHGPGRGAVIRGQRPQDGRLSYSRRAVEQHTSASAELFTRRREQILPADDQVGAAPGRLLEVPSHGHRSPPCVVSWPILGNSSLNFGRTAW